jgi:hypothetical protein
MKESTLMSDEDEARELNELYWTAIRSLFGNFIEEHPGMTSLLQASTEQIRELFSRTIRRLSDEGDAGAVGLIALWLVDRTPRDTLLNLAIWLEMEGRLDDDSLGDPEDP